LLPLPLPLNWQRHVTYMPNATWRRRGVATARGGGSPTLETEQSVSGKGGAQRRAAQAKRGSLGNPLRARGAELPLGVFVVAFDFCLKSPPFGCCFSVLREDEEQRLKVRRRYLFVSRPAFPLNRPRQQHYVMRYDHKRISILRDLCAGGLRAKLRRRCRAPLRSALCACLRPMCSKSTCTP
jgi:hypothetical protein